MIVYKKPLSNDIRFFGIKTKSKTVRNKAQN